MFVEYNLTAQKHTGCERAVFPTLLKVNTACHLCTYRRTCIHTFVSTHRFVLLFSKLNQIVPSVSYNLHLHTGYQCWRIYVSPWLGHGIPDVWSSMNWACLWVFLGEVKIEWVGCVKQMALPRVGWPRPTGGGKGKKELLPCCGAGSSVIFCPWTWTGT